MRLGYMDFGPITDDDKGGAPALARRPQLARCMERVTPAARAVQPLSTTPCLPLDIHTERAYHAPHIAGHLRIPLASLVHTCVPRTHA
jgi:hypothetical protein